MRILGTVAIALAASFAAATPASAVITTFANFSAGPGGANVQFLNAASNRNAVFFTTATNSSTTLGARRVTFNFVPSEFNAIGPVSALWSLSGAVTNTAAVIRGTNIFQSNIAGSFSFISTSAITFGSTTYAAGSNLLSGTFTNATIAGQRNGSFGGFSGFTPVSSITYTSDFLTFVPGSDYDFALALGEITPALNATPSSALSTFRAVASGQFSSDPAPIAAIPEPATWAMMIVGFGLVGGALRRRSATGGLAKA
ncbi:MAG: PEPxxWA-CTERM sorting domain-containing protein [Sphingomonas sp.]